MIRNLLLAVGLIVLIVTATPLAGWWAQALGGRWGDERGDILIVPGSDLTAPGVMGRGSYWRSVYAVLYWRGGHYRTLLLSGKDIAVPMSDFIVSMGVPRDAIVLENRSRDTHENALFTAQLLRNDPRGKVLLTSDYHMFRALRAFRKAGLEVSPIPFPDARKQANNPLERWSVFCSLVNETAKIGYYYLRGWI
jgi:uncharacterized SAM-binding protein YcdF (DUF218 family)